MASTNDLAIVRISGTSGHALHQLADTFLALDLLHREIAFLDSVVELADVSPKLARGLLREGSEALSARSIQSQLVFHSASFRSPGFWDFLGKLNPLEVIREYLNDRHRRRQDREYREAAEKRKLELQNFALENEIIKGRIEILEKSGFSNQELRLLVRRLIPPLERLELAGEARMLGQAEIIPIDLKQEAEGEALAEPPHEAAAREAVAVEEAEAVEDDEFFFDFLSEEDEEDEEDEEERETEAF